MMKRNGNVVEVLVWISIIKEARNVDVNEDHLATLAGQHGNKRISQSQACHVGETKGVMMDQMPMKQPTTNEIGSIEGE